MEGECLLMAVSKPFLEARCSSSEKVPDVSKVIERLPQYFWKVGTTAVRTRDYVLGHTCTSLNQLQVP